MLTTKYAVVIGGANMDITGYVGSNIIAKDSNPGKIQFSPGGVARNIAQNLVSLGIHSKLISIVGNDDLGHALLKDCHKLGIDTSTMIQSPGKKSSAYLNILDKTGEMAVGVSDMEIINDLNPGVLENHHQTINNAAAILVDTNLSEEALQYLALEFKNRIYLDTVSTTKTLKASKFIGNFKTIKPNRKEAEVLVGYSITSLADAEKAAKDLLEKGVEYIIITMGKAGIVYGSEQGIYSVSLPYQPGLNATGAGDAFLASMAYCELKGFDIHKSVRVSLVASMIAFQSNQASNPKLSEEYLLNIFNKSGL